MPPVALLLDVLLYAVLPALATAALVMAAVVLLAGAKHAPLGAALGLTAAAALGFWLREALTFMPGDSSWNRLPWAALGALWIGRLAKMPDLLPLEGWLLRAATSAAIAWWVIPEPAREETGWLAPAFAAVVLAEWIVLDLLAAQPPGGTIPFALSLAFFTASVVLIYARSARLNGAATVLSSAVFGIALVAGWRRVDSGGWVPAAAVLLPGLLLVGQQETFGLSWPAFALAAGAPLMLVLTLPLRQWQGVSLRVLQLTLVLLPLAVALYLAVSSGSLDE